jgi:hypothetical protein
MNTLPRGLKLTLTRRDLFNSFSAGCVPVIRNDEVLHAELFENAHRLGGEI